MSSKSTDTESLCIVPNQELTDYPYFDIFCDGVWYGSRRYGCKEVLSMSGEDIHDHDCCYCEEHEGHFLCPQNKC